MASSDALSANTRQAVLDQIPLQHKANLGSAQKRGLVAAGGAALYMGAAALQPVLLATAGASFVAGAIPVVTAIAMFAGSAIALIAGAKLLGNVSRAISLHQVKQNVKDEKFVPKLKKKAGDALSRAGSLNRISNLAFWGVVGAMFAASTVALAPLAAAIYPIAFGAMFVAWGAAEWNNGVAQGTTPIAKLVYDRQGFSPSSASVAAPAPQNAPKKSPSSLLGLFKRKAANANAAPTPAKKAAAKADAPKP